MKKIAIFGSTGSIGTQALEVIRYHSNRFCVTILTAGTNNKLLFAQAIEFNPECVCITHGKFTLGETSELKNRGIKIFYDRESLLDLASRTDVDLVLNSLVGSVGMQPTVNAVSSGVNIGLANKESMVMAGAMINRLAKSNNTKIYPIDSEHSAIWQCLAGEDSNEVKKIILTGSGGPFRTRSSSTFSTITRDEALKHPNWSMGNKITIDSATMMNKGLEVIEAKWLFNLRPDQIDIVVHPQSIVHSMVEFVDGSLKAQLGYPDMRIPIQYALTYPHRLPYVENDFSFESIHQLTFEKPDYQKFPCIRLAYDCLDSGGSFPVVLNVANDILVDAFLKGQIQFTNISEYIRDALETHEYLKEPDLTDIKFLTEWTIEYIRKQIME